MPTTRQLVKVIAIVDVGLFLLASALNDHSNTSFDGIVWWAAIGLFVVLIAIAMLILGRYLWTRRRRPLRARRRPESPG